MSLVSSLTPSSRPLSAAVMAKSSAHSWAVIAVYADASTAQLSSQLSYSW